MTAANPGFKAGGGVQRDAARRLRPRFAWGGSPGRARCATAEAAYVRCELDVLEPTQVQANRFPVPSGLSVTDVERAVSTIGAALPIRASLAAYVPEYDPEGRVAEAAPGRRIDSRRCPVTVILGNR